MISANQSQTDTFRRINIDHVFLCSHCEKCWLTKDLYKTQDNKYVCLHCNNAVKDVTFTPLGQAFIAIIRP